jgi:hypothetical protein
MKKISLILVSLVILIVFSSCATEKKVYRETVAQGYFSQDVGDKAKIGRLELHTDGIADLENAKTIDTDTQKIVYTARLSLTVKNPDSASKQIILLTKNSNGYVQTSNSDYLIIKIPTSGLNNILTEIEKLGKVTHKNVTADDITDSYYDAVTRLENLDKARTRYLELLAKAQTVEEMLKVEKELERVNGEMEVLKGRLARMDNSVQYSTINVYLKEKVKPGVLGYPFVWLYKGVSWLFVRN